MQFKNQTIKEMKRKKSKMKRTQEIRMHRERKRLKARLPSETDPPSEKTGSNDASLIKNTNILISEF